MKVLEEFQVIPDHLSEHFEICLQLSSNIAFCLHQTLRPRHDPQMVHKMPSPNQDKDHKIQAELSEPKHFRRILLENVLKEYRRDQFVTQTIPRGRVLDTVHSLILQISEAQLLNQEVEFI